MDWLELALGSECITGPKNNDPLDEEICQQNGIQISPWHSQLVWCRDNLHISKPGILPMPYDALGGRKRPDVQVTCNEVEVW